MRWYNLNKMQASLQIPDKVDKQAPHGSLGWYFAVIVKKSCVLQQKYKPST